MNHEKALEKVIYEFYGDMHNLICNNQTSGKRNCVNKKYTYQRTILGIEKILPNLNKVISELGSVLNIVSKTFHYQGYKVNTCDIPSNKNS